MSEKILEIQDLHVAFKTLGGNVQAVRGVNLELNKGETIAIVGESGSGKSVTVRTIMRLLADNASVKKGKIIFQGDDLIKKSIKEMESIRGDEITMIFQDPMTSLNPLMKIGEQVAEPMIEHKGMAKSDAIQKAIELLDSVGLPNAAIRINNYPHQFSGGQRQRINIAMALACDPKILIADEPTTALDVTIQAQILELFKAIQKQSQTSIIFITHDLGVVANIADKVAVMYAGKVIEYGTVNEVFYNPQHPYTWGLIGSMPSLKTEGRLLAIPGSVPDLTNPPKGDVFAYRSKYSLAIDFEEEPPFFEVSPTHFAATWLLHPFAPKVEVPEEIKRRYEIFNTIKVQ